MAVVPVTSDAGWVVQEAVGAVVSIVTVNAPEAAPWVVA